MPPDTFKGQPKPVSTVGFPTVLITNKDLPEPIAYTVTKTVVENKDALVRGHGGLAEFDPTDGVAAREGRHPSASGRRAGVPREGVDEIARRLVLLNGRILTLDPAAADRLGARRSRTGASPRRAGAARSSAAGERRSQVIDLRGATVIPGLVDAHAHLDREGLKLIYPSLARCRSIADIQRLLRAQAARRKPGRVDRHDAGRRPAVLPGRARLPGRAALADPRGPRRGRARPPGLHPRDLGLLEPPAGLLGREQPRPRARRASPARRSPPPGVEIVKDAAGEPTGVFVEHNLIQVLEFTLMREAPRFTPDDRRRALRVSQRRYAARGVTAVYEGHGIAPEVLAAYRESHARGELRLRCSAGGQPDVGRGRGRARHPGRWRRGRAGAGSATIACAWAASACTTAATPSVARILHASQPYTGWAGFVESANDPAAYARAGRAGRAPRAARQHAGDALPARGPRRVGGGGATPSHPRPALGPRPSQRGHPRAARAHPPARRRRHDQPHLLSLPLGGRRGGQARRRRRPAPAPPEPGPPPHPVRHRHRQQAGRPVGGLRGRRGPPRHADRAWSWASASGSRAPRRSTALTQGGAWVTFAERDRGRLAPGWAADLAVLEHDPLTAPLEDRGRPDRAPHPGRRRDRSPCLISARRACCWRSRGRSSRSTPPTPASTTC